MWINDKPAYVPDRLVVPLSAEQSTFTAGQAISDVIIHVSREVPLSSEELAKIEKYEKDVQDALSARAAAGKVD